MTRSKSFLRHTSSLSFRMGWIVFLILIGSLSVNATIDPAFISYDTGDITLKGTAGVVGVDLNTTGWLYTVDMANSSRYVNTNYNGSIGIHVDTGMTIYNKTALPQNNLSYELMFYDDGTTFSVGIKQTTFNRADYIGITNRGTGVYGYSVCGAWVNFGMPVSAGWHKSYVNTRAINDHILCISNNTKTECIQSAASCNATYSFEANTAQLNTTFDNIFVYYGNTTPAYPTLEVSIDTLNLSALYPANNTQFNLTNLTAWFTVNASFDFNVSWYVDNILNTTVNYTAGSEKNITFIAALTEGTHNIYASLLENISQNTTNNTFYFDITYPTITSSIPDHTTSDENTTMYMWFNASDTNLYLFNLTDGNNVSYFFDSINATSKYVDFWINASNYALNALHTINYVVCDSPIKSLLLNCLSGNQTWYNGKTVGIISYTTNPTYPNYTQSIYFYANITNITPFTAYWNLTNPQGTKTNEILTFADKLYNSTTHNMNVPGTWNYTLYTIDNATITSEYSGKIYVPYIYEFNTTPITPKLGNNISLFLRTTVVKNATFTISYANGTQLLNESLTSINGSYWNSSISRRMVNNTYSYSYVVYFNFSNYSQTDTKTFTISDNTAFIPNSINKQPLTTKNETTITQISYYTDSNENFTVNWNCTMENSSLVNISVMNLTQYLGGTSLSSPRLNNITIQANITAPDFVYIGRCMATVSLSGLNDVNYTIPITYSVNPPSGLPRWYAISGTRCDNTDTGVCFAGLSTSAGSPTATRQYTIKNDGFYNLSECNIGLRSTLGGMYNWAAITPSNFSIETGSQSLVGVSLTPPTGTYSGWLTINCTKASAFGYSQSSAESNEPRISITATASIGGAGGGGGGGEVVKQQVITVSAGNESLFKVETEFGGKRNELSVVPGQKRTFKTIVTSLSSKTQNLTLKCEGECLWITNDVQSFALFPAEFQELRTTITVPDTAKYGETQAINLIISDASDNSGKIFTKITVSQIGFIFKLFDKFKEMKMFGGVPIWNGLIIMGICTLWFLMMLLIPKQWMIFKGIMLSAGTIVVFFITLILL